MDGGDDGDHNDIDSSGYDADNEDEDEDEEEEEYLAPADSATVIPIDELASPPEETESIIDGYHYSCTCPQCGVILLNEMCINCTYGNGNPVTCCVCKGPLKGGFCLPCHSKAENSFTYDPNVYSFNDTSSNFNHLPQPQYETYLCELCGNDSHYGYYCQQQLPLVYEQELSYNQNYNGFYPKLTLKPRDGKCKVVRNKREKDKIGTKPDKNEKRGEA
nr:hypothetical protein [Tanacetum cinerariifolium]